MISFELFPTTTPSLGWPVRRATASMSRTGGWAGYRFQGSLARASTIFFFKPGREIVGGFVLIQLDPRRVLIDEIRLEIGQRAPHGRTAFPAGSALRSAGSLPRTPHPGRFRCCGAGG